MTMSGSWWHQGKEIDPVSLQKRYDANRERRQKQRDASNAGNEENASADNNATNGGNAEVASDDGSLVIVKAID